MRVAVFGDAHAHAEALEAVMAAAEASGAEQLWSLGDMVGGGPDPERVVALTRERCRVALVGNHDYGATGSVDPSGWGSRAPRDTARSSRPRPGSSEPDIAWLRARKPAARRDDVQCWHGSPRNAVWEFVGPANAGACLAVQRAPLGLVAHTHVAAAWRARRRRRGGAGPVSPGHAARHLHRQVAPQSRAPWAPRSPRGSAGGTAWTRRPPTGRSGCCSTWPERTATWHRAPFDPAPARARARALGLDDR